MKQKERGPFHRCLVDRSLHHHPKTKASKTYSQQSLEFHIKDGGTPDGACKFGRLSRATRLHFPAAYFPWLQSLCSSSLRWALPGLWVMGSSSHIPPAFPGPWWRCARADGTDLSPLGHRTPLVFRHAFAQRSCLAETLGSVVLAWSTTLMVSVGLIRISSEKHLIPGKLFF